MATLAERTTMETRFWCGCVDRYNADISTYFQYLLIRIEQLETENRMCPDCSWRAEKSAGHMPHWSED